MSPIQYLSSLRLERARYLLQATFLSVTEITRRIGAQDDSHFVRDFKKAYGETPTRYRKRRLGAHLNKTRTLPTPLNESPRGLNGQKILTTNSKNRQRK